MNATCKILGSPRYGRSSCGDGLSCLVSCSDLSTCIGKKGRCLTLDDTDSIQTSALAGPGIDPREVVNARKCDDPEVQVCRCDDDDDCQNSPDGSRWCFLVNIENPAQPTSKCFPDVKWSRSNSRFFSFDACNNPETKQSRGSFIEESHGKNRQRLKRIRLKNIKLSSEHGQGRAEHKTDNIEEDMLDDQNQERYLYKALAKREKFSQETSDFYWNFWPGLEGNPVIRDNIDVIAEEMEETAAHLPFLSGEIKPADGPLGRSELTATPDVTSIEVSSSLAPPVIFSESSSFQSSIPASPVLNRSVVSLGVDAAILKNDLTPVHVGHGAHEFVTSPRKSGFHGYEPSPLTKTHVVASQVKQTVANQTDS